MNRKLERKLYRKFKFLRAVNPFTLKEFNWCTSLDMNDGWYKLIRDLCKELKKYFKAHKEVLETFYVTQAKEKYGGLRFYISASTTEVFNIIHKYENKSYKICEICGKPGQLNGRGWHQTLCEKHRIERGYPLTEEEEES